MLVGGSVGSLKSVVHDNETVCGRQKITESDIMISQSQTVKDRVRYVMIDEQMVTLVG